MKVYCYHETLPGWDDSDIIEPWRESWARNGWTPVVLGMEHVRNHPLCRAFIEIVSELPTVNDPGYELACYRRWLAMATVGGGLLTDYDIMNRCFTTEHLPPQNGLTVLGWPTPVYGDAQAFETMARLFMLYRPDNKDVVGSQPHVSDMTMTARIRLGSFIKSSPCVPTYGGAGWNTAALVHYSNNSVGGPANKFSAIALTFPNKTTP